MSSGEKREYILRVPDNYDHNRPYRLIFAFHWFGGTAHNVDDGGESKDGWAYYGLVHKDISNGSAIFVAPQGLGNGWSNPGGKDVIFVDDMIRQIETSLCIDTTQRFAMGFSYGGGMTYALACARPTVFRAVAVYGGRQLSGCAGGTEPVAYIGIHGLGDNVIGINDGRALRDRFVRNNGCTPQDPPEPAAGSLTHLVTHYSGCKPGYPVAWAPFDGGHAPNAVDGTTNPFAPGEGSWTQAVVWKFFTEIASFPTPSPSAASPSPSPSQTPSPGPVSPSATPTPSAPSTPPDANPACRATFKASNSWPGGFQGEVTVTNPSAADRSGWTVRMTLGSGQVINSLWNGVNTGTSGAVTVKNAPYNGSLGAGASTTFGFVAAGNGAPALAAISCTSP
ncbi:MAG TPA: cellulose binding domain-containing protein [Actinoplanes sp.]|nr:cellulose binding domain-containing protein [Actinoplanes sp.]